MDLRQFWATWRRDILRGAVIFTVVLVAGLAIVRFYRTAREGMRTVMNRDFNLDDGGPAPPPSPDAPAETSATWTWSGRVAPRQSVWIRNVNGSVKVEPAAGDDVQVTAVKSGRRSQFGRVRLDVAPEQGVTICAVWSGGRARCGAQGDYEGGRMRGGNDVRVDFTVRLPRRVRIDAFTVNGDVEVAGAAAPVKARTVNGRIEAHTSAGPIEASDVNGSIHAAITAFADSGPVSAKTVNGSVTLELPARLDAHVEATTLTGSIESDFPLTASEGLIPRRFSGTVGSGARAIKLGTLHGSITLRKLPPKH